MANKSKRGRKVIVRPTAPKERGDNQYTDIALTGLLGIHSGQINSARQAVWQRYTAMLIANSIIIGFMGGGGQLLEKFDRAVAAFGGIALCCSWLALLIVDNQGLARRIVRANEFRWSHISSPHANPFLLMTEEDRGIGQVVFVLPAVVIWIFFVLHVSIAIWLFTPHTS